MNHFLTRANDLKEEMVANRRYLHANAELGFDLPKTTAYVTEQLRSYGYEPIALGGGIVCTIGSGEPVLMLRADMDALPQAELSGMEFASKTKACHSCGHDFHTTMLLAAAKILKESEDQLKGTVKFMFQPAEETLQGAQRMLDAGVLENPKVDASMAMHLSFGPNAIYNQTPGSLRYSRKQMCASADEFRITVKGKAAHGSAAFMGVSAIHVAANIITALHQSIPLEFPNDETVVLTIGKVQGGTATNIVPEDAVIEGSCRTFSFENRALLKKRIAEIVDTTATMWRATAEVDFFRGVGPNINNPELSIEMARYCEEVMVSVTETPPIKASEDYAVISEHVPSFYCCLSAGGPEEGCNFPHHNPKARIDENVLPYGAAVFCNCAVNWLKNHSSQTD